MTKENAKQANIFDVDAMKANVTSASGILVLIQCLSSSVSEIVIESLRASEAIVARSAKNQTLWREQGVFARLLPLLSSENESVLQHTLQFTRALIVDNGSLLLIHIVDIILITSQIVKSQDELRSAGYLPRIIALLPCNKLAIQGLLLLLLLNAIVC